MIRDAGLRHKRYESETVDGYILQLDRIVNKGVFNVVLFMHGELDSARMWVANGQDRSAAYMAHRNGFDVFMGNFRGVSPRKLADWKQRSSESYWNYKIDDLAKHDVSAFVKKILALKVNEIMILMQNYAVKRGSSIKRMGLTNSQLKNEIRAKIKLTFVGHSLGAVVLPIYLLHCKTNDLEHSVA